MKKLFLLVLAVATLSCANNSNQVPSTGNPYELIIVSSKEVANSMVLDTLKSIFAEEVKGISRSEPIFDMYSVRPNAMSTLVQKHRNLLFVKVDPKFTVNEFYADTNQYAKGQLSIYFQGPSVDTLASYIHQNQEYLIGLLNKYERDRFVKRVNKFNEKGLQSLINKKFGFEMRVPQGYRVKVDDDNFLWLTFETKLGSLGIVIYTFDEELGGTNNWLIAQRNVAANRIPGPSDGSYMSTETRFQAETMMVEINGIQWYKTRGLWMVENDFMGGPFVNYVTEYKGKYIAIDFFVQEPDVRKTHRNYIRQFEALPVTITFPNN